MLATVLSLGLRGRLERPQGTGPSLAGRVAAFPVLVGGLLVEVLRGTWDVGLRVVGLRPVECPGIVLVPIGERTELGVAVTGLLAGLSPGSMLVEVDRTSKRYDDFQKWCREIVWWGNKKGAYLYSPRSAAITPELAGNY